MPSECATPAAPNDSVSPERGTLRAQAKTFEPRLVVQDSETVSQQPPHYDGPFWHQFPRDEHYYPYTEDFSPGPPTTTLPAECWPPKCQWMLNETQRVAIYLGETYIGSVPFDTLIESSKLFSQYAHGMAPFQPSRLVLSLPTRRQPTADAVHAVLALTHSLHGIEAGTLDFEPRRLGNLAIKDVVDLYQAGLAFQSVVQPAWRELGLRIKSWTQGPSLAVINHFHDCIPLRDTFIEQIIESVVMHEDEYEDRKEWEAIWEYLYHSGDDELSRIAELIIARSVHLPTGLRRRRPRRQQQQRGREAEAQKKA